MPQLVKKRRSGWAVLAAGALVASIFAVVGANPALGAERNADQQSQWKACLGPALAGSGFTDVAMDSVHYDNINCLAYYGITTGKTDDTFDPQSNVTRSQMALFLARAADKAGIDLGDSTDMGFADVAGLDAERASAINSLVSAGIMFGDTNSSFDPPSTTHFAPSDHVTRWEMAMFLFAFLDHALDSVFIDQLPTSVDGDGVGAIELRDFDGDGVGEQEVDDYFRDAERQTPAHIADQIGAIYELGVTTGTNGMVGEAGTFEPNGLVTRAQMASFIMRALAHTNLRPAGLTAQHTMTETQVSVRNADFEPVVDARVEVFYSNFADHAFDNSGECVGHFVGHYAPSFAACEIDRGDERTNDFGNHVFPFGTQLSNTLSIMCSQPPNTGGTAGSYTLTIDAPSSIAMFTAWAWQGDLYDEVDGTTRLFEVEPANAVSTGAEATHAVVSGGPAELRNGFEHFKMGELLTYNVQLSAQDADGNYVPAPPSAGENYGFAVTIIKHYQAADGTTGAPDATVTFPFAISLAAEQTRLPGVFYPDSTGSFNVPVSNPDPIAAGPNRDNRDVQVQIVVSPLPGNTLTIVDSTTGTAITDAANGTVSGEIAATTTPPAAAHVVSKAARFSDNDPAAAAVSIEPETALKVLAETDRNSVSVSVLDQYNNPFRPPAAGYAVVVDPSSIVDDADTTTVDESTGTSIAIRSFGRGSYGYRYGGGSTPSIENIAVNAALMDLAAATNATADVDGATTARVYWAGLGSEVRETTAEPVYIADASQRLIAIEGDAGQPIVYAYGDADKFVVEGEVVSFEQFEAIISAPASAVSLAGPDEDPTVTADNATLEWDDYRRSGISRRPTTDATWRLDNLACGTRAS
jgi:hypothetical protein